jgi:hypothetical protein
MIEPPPAWTLSRRRFLASVPVLCAMQGGGVLQVVHQGAESVGDTRNDYYWTLLDNVLARTAPRWGPYELSAAPILMNGPRSYYELQKGALTILARSTGTDLEQTLLPIRIPLDKGLLGYRVFLIRAQMQAELDQVKTLQDLQRYSIGQAAAWNDVPILQAAGFRIVPGANYEGLFAMLAGGRFDLFSRSVVEAVTELEPRKSRYPNLVIERNLLLYYPLPRYLFVRRDACGEQLARRLLEGFEILLKDGSFDRLFAAYREPIERALAMKSRRLFRIPNPTLSPQTPLNRTELWYDPTQ